jgi:RNA polymerase primary sigma factor
MFNKIKAVDSDEAAAFYVGIGDVQGSYEAIAEESSPAVEFSLQQYMREVNMSPLLSHKRTMEMFGSLEEKEMELDKLTKSPRLSMEESKRVGSLKRELAEIKEQLVLSNLRLVVYLANRYRNRGIPIQDLVQEGNIGLIRAIDKFDYKLGFRFSTYATWWIRQGMLRAIHQHGRLIRIPTHMLEKLQHYIRDGDDRKKQTHQRKRMPAAKDPDKRQQDMIHLMEVMRDPLSLDTRVTEDGLDLQEVTRDENQLVPEDLLIEQDLREKLREAIISLTFREEIILRMRYGIDLPQTHTLEEVGQIFGLTKERIRQIESRALRRLHDAHAC